MDIQGLRAQFPVLRRVVLRDGRELPLTYLDSAATALKPQAVIDAVSSYYSDYGVNVHRGAYELSQQATDRFEAVRAHIGRYFNIDERYTVVLTHGATESLNIVAHGWAAHNLQPSDEMLITELDHHANIVPWQQVRDSLRCSLRYLPVAVEAEGEELPMASLGQWFSEKTRLLAISGLSNVTGWHTPLAKIIEVAHRQRVTVVVDGAQLAAHERVDISALDCDFFACSAHKMFGPTGVGVLIGKKKLLDQTAAFIGGGNMISEVYMERSLFKPPPERFEAGTPPIASVIGFGAALDLLEEWDFAAIAAHEWGLTEAARSALSAIPEVELYGGASEAYRGVVAFNVRGAHSHDVGSILDQEGVAVRAGHHCAQPYHRALGADSSVRASFHLYNSAADVEALVRGVRRAVNIFAKQKTVARK